MSGLKHLSTSMEFDDDLSMQESSESTRAMTGDSKSEPDEYQQMTVFARKDTDRINAVRVFVVTIILCVGAALSTFTYLLLQNQIEQDSSDAFLHFASNIEDKIKFRVSNIFSANLALSREITTSAFGSEFPYVAVPAWEAAAHESRIQAGFETVTYAPVTERIDLWLNFSQASRGWLDESKRIYDDLEPGKNRAAEPPTGPLPNAVYDFDDNGELSERDRDGLMVPSLHVSPPPLQSVDIYQNINMFSNPQYRGISQASAKLRDSVFSAFNIAFVDLTDQLIGSEDDESLDATDRRLHPHSIAAQPVYKGLGEKADDVVGYLYSVVSWESYLLNLLPEDGPEGLIVVLRNSCGQAVTYELSGAKAVFLSDNDMHGEKYDAAGISIDFAENYIDSTLTSQVEGHCQVFLDVYPSTKFESAYESKLPVISTTTVGGLFVFMAAAFFLYDWFVQTRNKKVIRAAARSNAIVSSLFPSNVRDRLLADQDGGHKHKNLQGFLSGRYETTDDQIFKTAPIAEFYPETTILFADIAGFTAWSSSREPSQVFTLLETLYHEFDEIARRRGIFKVETVGDCYVAVSGLPDPRKDHAVAMCRFAKECMYKTWNITKRLSVTLGPDTDDLTMRIGIHSGPVTAGVLRGERSRFQLFGDTMNTASRMESNGCRSRIQVSQETVDCLTKAGKGNWVKPREEAINAKGKGQLNTYWLDISDHFDVASQCADNTTRHGLYGTDESEYDGTLFGSRDVMTKASRLASAKTIRLVDWNVEVLCRLLKRIVAFRRARDKYDKSRRGEKVSFSNEPTPEGLVLDEVAETIALPQYDPRFAREMDDPESIVLSPLVVEQLTDFVSRIAALYNDNPFHNFEHASHVTMSVQKLLARIVAPNLETEDEKTLHDHTYGITSDPLTQLACVLSALIHDVDHQGVPNSQLVKEKAPIASYYKGRTVAEQNSVDLAWDLLSSDQYQELRSTIYTTVRGRKRFRQLVVNSVMATDIMDKELKAQRNARWDKAFKELPDDCTKEARDRKATIVIEHLIQASDVAHTMQHWHVYRKWNERLFLEMYKAYKEGRAETNPADNWYKGEIGFFDFYIIPLAKKLKDCGVFGVSSDEYLNYAEKNRAEWEAKGEEVVANMLESISKKN